MKGNTKFSGVGIGPDFPMESFHKELQRLRQNNKDVSLKSYLRDSYGEEMSPEKFYREAGIDNLGAMTVQKMLNTTELNRWLFPEIFRDAIRRGLLYTPFYSQLVIGEENIDSTGITMPFMDLRQVDQEELRLRDVNEGATIPEGEIIAWQTKQITVHKKAKGLKQTYESLMFTPINLASVYFEEVGVRLGADLDAALVAIAFNGDQADLSESAPVMGAAAANTLAYSDIARVWIRLKRLGRSPGVMLASEADAITILNMPQFLRTVPAGAQTPSGVEISISTPLPTDQAIFVHGKIPTGKLIFVDTTRAFVQLTAMPLLIESEKIVSRQLQGEYVSIITGFANVFRDGRLVLDYTTSLITNPGPVPVL